MHQAEGKVHLQDVTRRKKSVNFRVYLLTDKTAMLHAQNALHLAVKPHALDGAKSVPLLDALLRAASADAVGKALVMADSEGRVPLMAAIERKSVPAAELLLDVPQCPVMTVEEKSTKEGEGKGAFYIDSFCSHQFSK